MIEIERWIINEKWEAVKYSLVPPRPWVQFNLNKLFGSPQTELIRLERIH